MLSCVRPIPDNDKVKFPIRQHTLGRVHKKIPSLFPLISQLWKLSKGLKEMRFFADTTKMLLACDLPLNAVENPAMVRFVEKYGKQKTP